jgi:hypothetical protein
VREKPKIFLLFPNESTFGVVKGKKNIAKYIIISLQKCAKCTLHTFANTFSWQESKNSVSLHQQKSKSNDNDINESRTVSAHHLHNHLYYLIYISNTEQPAQDTTAAKPTGQHPRHAETGSH